MKFCKKCSDIKIFKNKDGVNECPKCSSKYSDSCNGYELNECIECPFCNMFLSPEDIPCEHLISSGDGYEDYWIEDFEVANDLRWFEENHEVEVNWSNIFKDSPLESVLKEFLNQDCDIFRGIEYTDGFSGIEIETEHWGGESPGRSGVYTWLFMNKKDQEFYKKEIISLYNKVKKKYAKEKK